MSTQQDANVTRISGKRGFVSVRILRQGQGVRVLEAVPNGRLESLEMHDMMTRLITDPDLGPNLPVLWDLRGFDFEVYQSPEYRGHAFLLQKFPQRSGVKRGYLVNSDTGFGTMRMFQQTVSGFGFDSQENLRISYDRDELLLWLADSRDTGQA